MNKNGKKSELGLESSAILLEDKFSRKNIKEKILDKQKIIKIILIIILFIIFLNGIKRKSSIRVKNKTNISKFNINKENKEAINNNKINTEKEKIPPNNNQNIKEDKQPEIEKKILKEEPKIEQKVEPKEETKPAIKPLKKIKFVDFYGGFESDNNAFYNLLKTRYTLELSNNPDYVIFDTFGSHHYSYDRAIKIFTTCEAAEPNFNQCDYALSYKKAAMGDRSIYYHLSGAYFNVKPKREYKPGKKFCSFLVSNGGCSMRNDFFQELSKYKKVDSGGSFQNNIGHTVGRGSGTFKFLGDYKFNICFENRQKEGYKTEKIFHAFEAGAIPIYWGDPTVLEIINPKSIIYIRGREDFKEAIELIKKIDQDEELYKEYLNARPYNDVDFIEKEKRKFKNFWFHIFDQDIECARRRHPVNSEKCKNNKIKEEKDYYNID